MDSAVKTPLPRGVDTIWHAGIYCSETYQLLQKGVSDIKLHPQVGAD
jgi:hypothetical protein